MPLGARPKVCLHRNPPLPLQRSPLGWPGYLQYDLEGGARLLPPVPGEGCPGGEAARALLKSRVRQRWGGGSKGGIAPPQSGEECGQPLGLVVCSCWTSYSLRRFYEDRGIWLS